jgi:glycosyltransferase involved in cell wall biosynthesis|tara:strand:+ start:4611 stop:6059 length:1449 start_codon:yes stop_codon:yes gene_type:complete
MKDNFGYVPREERKKVLLLADDIRMHSGIATMAREFVVNTANHFNWYQLGAGINHPDAGKVFDLNDDINKRINITDADVKIEPFSGYGDVAKIRQLIKSEKPDAILIFTDPRYWTWLFEIEREIRSEIPICWLNIWDDYPAPMYNKPYYNSVDLLMAISKQTKNINELVLGPEADNKVIKYVPHGIDEEIFFPIGKKHPLYTDYLKFKSELFQDKEIDYVVFYNSRNIARKHPSDVILAYQEFCDKIGKDKAKRCALLMHTAIVDPHGTDLKAVKDAITDPEYVNIYFSAAKLTPQQMNLLYNVADLTVLMSSNEGWGLSLTESMMAGTMIAANVTGGMQDQMRFTDEKGKWIDFDSDFPSNHRGTYKECGSWALPIFPSNICLAGSPNTPYIFDDRCSSTDAAKTMVEAYELGEDKRAENGIKGRVWVTSKESQMSSKNMCLNIIGAMEEVFEKFKPRPEFDLIRVEESTDIKVKHKITGY